MLPTNVLLGLIAGLTIFLGLPIARWDKASERLRGILSLISAGVLLFLIIEVGYQAMELVESNVKSGTFLGSSLIFVTGFLLGLIGLAWIEDLRRGRQTTESKPLEVATMIALGIGLHNFAEGLAIGQLFSSGATSLGMVLVIGFSLHNATEGFGIAAPLAGLKVNWRTLFMLGLIGGLPTALGACLGGVWVNASVELLFLSLATGSLIYVTRELLRLRYPALKAVTAMGALAAGILIGFGTELVAEVGQNHSTNTAQAATVLTIRFKDRQALPDKVTLSRGQILRLENEQSMPLVFEGNGLFVGEVVVTSHGKTDVAVTGNPGQYQLQDERNQGATALITVQTGTTQEPLSDEVNAVGALTVLEGHVRASKDLHDRGVSGQGPDPVLDLKRAGKHAAHPQHELLMGHEPHALNLQRLLRKHNVLDSLNDALSAYIKVSGDNTVAQEEINRRYLAALAATEKARKAIAGQVYNLPSFRLRVAKFVLETAVSEYATATEGGYINVEEPGTPGKDNFIEYQDARSFIKSAYELLIAERSAGTLTGSSKRAFNELLNGVFQSLDPPNPEHPVSVNQVKSLIKCIDLEEGN